MLSIKKVLMDRDGLSSDEADDKIAEGKIELTSLIEKGSYLAHEFMQDYFGLEQDYVYDMFTKEDLGI